MSIDYDKDADALYITLAEGEIEETIKVADGVMVDIDKSGEIIGIEILWASKRLPMEKIKIKEITA